MKNDNYDVGYIDDAISLVQNLTATEHHIATTFSETLDNDYLELLTKVRRDRSTILLKIAPKSKGQLYCMFKHLLNCIQNYKELGNRELEDGNIEGARELFIKADEYEKLIKLLREEKAESKEGFKLFGK